jgi:hypothetical protein
MRKKPNMKNHKNPRECRTRRTVLGAKKFFTRWEIDRQAKVKVLG